MTGVPEASASKDVKPPAFWTRQALVAISGNIVAPAQGDHAGDTREVALEASVGVTQDHRLHQTRGQNVAGSALEVAHAE